jgi:transcriptional regulator with XRE-family HTH domain
MTPAQCRAARSLLDWTQAKLAEAARIGTSIVTSFERSGRAVAAGAVHAMQHVLEAAGVEFLDGEEPGVQLKKTAGCLEEISQQIDALEDKISSLPAPTEPSPEAGMNIMRKAVAKNDLAKLKNRRTRITRPDRSK